MFGGGAGGFGQQPSQQPMFGNQPAQQQGFNPAGGSSLFGGTGGGSTFGGGFQAPAAPGGAFGTAFGGGGGASTGFGAPAQTGFGAAPGGGSFGAQGGYGAARPQQGGFGAPAQTGFGAPAQTGFGAPAQTGFGAPAQTGFGAPAQTGFGAPAQGGFGAPAQSGFGAPAQTGFGAPAQGGFGAPAQTGFGAPAQTGFGAPAQTGFGAPQQQTGFGAAPGGAFGTQGGFGAPQTGFGAPAAQPQGFGAPAAQPQGFGAPTAGFGASSGGFGSPSNPGWQQPGTQQQPGMQAPESHNPGNESEIRKEDRPSDTITSVRFTPVLQQNFVAVSSWDSSIRLFQLVPQNGLPVPQRKATITCSGPILDSAFKSDGSALFGASADGSVLLWNIAAGATQAQTVGRHDAPVKCVAWINEINLLASAGWDKTIRYWDLRQQNPVNVVQIAERAHCMSLKYPYMVVAGGGPTFPIYMFNLQKSPNIPERERNIPSASSQNVVPKMAIRSVAISTDKTFYACAGIEARVSIQHIDANASGNFTFRGHRIEEGTAKFYNPINDVQFHPQSNVFATCGGDGHYCFWNHVDKSRVHHGPQVPIQPGMAAKDASKRASFAGGSRLAPILCSGFNAEGNVFAYALGYDWSQGAQGNNPQTQVNAVVFHNVSPSELKSKSTITTNAYRR